MSYSKYKSYWFVNGSLHWLPRNSRSGDLVTAYDYDAGRYKKYYRSAWDTAKKRAYCKSDIANLLERPVGTVQRWMKKENMPRGTMARNPETGGYVAMFWDEAGVWEVWEYSRTKYIGRPDPGVELPTRALPREVLRAKLNEDSIVYVKKDGEFIPVWKELL